MSQETEAPTSTRDTPGSYPTQAEQQEESSVSGPRSISQAVKARQSEYTTKRQIKVKVGTWNVASIHGTEKDLQGWFVDGLGVHGLSESSPNLSMRNPRFTDKKKENQEIAAIEPVGQQEARRARKKVTLPKNDIPAVPGGTDIGLYVLGLQEIVDVASASEALKLFTDPGPSSRWKDAVNKGLPKGYAKVAEQQLVGLLTLVFASPEVAPTISSVSSTSVGTGLMGYMGNKGGTATRIVLGETTRMVFVNCHLAAGADSAALDRRNWDCSQITSRIRFEPIVDSTGVADEFGDKIGDEDFAFWFGDLNYRLDDMPGEDVRHLLLLHTRNEYDINNKSKRKIDSELGYVDAPSGDIKSSIDSQRSEQDSDTSSFSLDPQDDPASLHTTLKSLLSHDQLQKQMRNRKAFHDGWREGNIDFLPTYKYDIGSVGMFDSGEKRRAPSWCDRILYRTRRDRLEYLELLEQEEESQKKDKDMEARGIDSPEDNDILFDYDPNIDGNAEDYDYDENENENEGCSPDPSSVPVDTRNGFDDTITLDQYTSHQRVLSSDHKPLSAIFTLTYDSEDTDLRAKIHQEVARELDKVENEGRPDLTIVIDRQKEHDIVEKREADSFSGELRETLEQSDEDVNSLGFGYVRFDVPKHRTITIANTGSVAASWYFMDRTAVEGETNVDTQSGVTPAWIEMNVEKESDNKNSNLGALQQYTLQPGETAGIEITLRVKDFEFVRRLNEDRAPLEDILLLRIENGRDHFLPVNGKWLPTCFARDLEELTIMLDGVRPSQLSTRTPSLRDKDETTEQPRLSAPRELFALTDAIQDLIERAIAEQSMVSGAESPPPPWSPNSQYEGWPFDAKSLETRYSTRRPELEALIRESLDTGAPITTSFPQDTTNIQRLEALCSTLLLFLQSLPDGIIAPPQWAQIESHLLNTEKFFQSKTQSSQREDIQSSVQEILSQRPVASVCWTFIIFMLKRVLAELAPHSQPSLSLEILHEYQSRSSTSTPSRKSIEEAEIPLQKLSPTSTTPTTTPTKKYKPPLISSPSSIFGSLRGRRARNSTAASTITTQPPPQPSDDGAQRRAHAEAEAAEKHASALRSAYARIFADAVVRCAPRSLDDGGTTNGKKGLEKTKEKEKDRKAREERRRMVVEVFLF